MRRLLFFLLVATSCLAATPEGIPRDFARERARLISDVRYQLRYTLTPHATSTSGHEVLTFQLKAAALRDFNTLRWRGMKPRTAAPLLLDFREGSVNRLLVNG